MDQGFTRMALVAGSNGSFIRRVRSFTLVKLVHSASSFSEVGSSVDKMLEMVELS